jgi:hypothetical protein
MARNESVRMRIGRLLLGCLAVVGIATSVACERTIGEDDDFGGVNVGNPGGGGDGDGNDPPEPDPIP